MCEVPFAFTPDPRVAPPSEPLTLFHRRLSDLEGCFRDSQAYARARRAQDDIVYTVVQNSPPRDTSHVLTGTCFLQPGKIGDEFYLTRGHTHVAERAEMYHCAAGTGLVLMQRGERCEVISLTPRAIVYVPPGWAHRLVNTGPAVLVTVFAVAADAGHDYEYVRAHPFSKTIVERDGQPLSIAAIE